MQKKTLVALIAATTILAGCGEVKNTQGGSQAPLVVTQDVIVIDYQPSKSYIGRIEAVEDTNITAQVSGYLKARHFDEGQMVEKGQLLYTIEPSSFEAQVASAKAALAQAKAALKKAELDHQRGKNLLPRGSISQSEFDALTAALLGARAELEAANAQLKLAEVNLSYTQIRAPFSGRISDTKVSTGDLVSPSSGVLTTLVSLDPVHTSFSVSERERLAMGMDKVKGDGSAESSNVEVQLELENGEFFEHLGQLDFLGNRINTQTGTIAMRAIVTNPDHKLLPGQHIKVNLRDKNTRDVIVVPRRAVQTDLEGDFVMITTEGNVAERRNVVLGPQVEQGIIIRDGLDQNDSVITQGLQRVRNGVEVSIQTPTEDKQ
ncbi:MULTISPECIES: multidrug efflux RND transporter periplasmic adaptor subunit VmeY [Vibrio]|jgi:membrane fusion protein (multidrug efflux system)|uniref:Efflux transporter periplasmic adaptor subunit n=1 Tax=Vibrio natriegens NBRC 15636 = ATCC 14048 = DSM 759 TaxID=1219067 RepID=A0AAN0Y7C6_VIBNA|nr:MULTISPECIES: multidrug efflux RND transporter periplasmic adaptor subunit VmeY [Vibrio]ALR17879.1 membrane protein [Vibrio natriegens NBRC 15636 = ATCC 14048 = DSM 759]ANQ15372.1 efflux transporter periplasmic adaptor subunit [Vibrio natriegens NBRC 15636 = ATCC 14048 = DSM 759]ANQ23720.1 efflux transporter periplasmic adaptor subunit [Vibrio natriegens]ANQ28016.1 efflux transporter periplasmic adaptor subunit [Vibrio natriegens]EPM41080.1 membrane protein [Vibrio natriegens NBRC 15636 = A